MRSCGLFQGVLRGGASLKSQKIMSEVLLVMSGGQPLEGRISGGAIMRATFPDPRTKGHGHRRTQHPRARGRPRHHLRGGAAPTGSRSRRRSSPTERKIRDHQYAVRLGAAAHAGDVFRQPPAPCTQLADAEAGAGGHRPARGGVDHGADPEPARRRARGGGGGGRGPYGRLGLGNAQPEEREPDNRRLLAGFRGGLRIVGQGRRRHPRAGIATAFGCPFEGVVPPEQVAKIAKTVSRAWRGFGRAGRHQRAWPPPATVRRRGAGDPGRGAGGAGDRPAFPQHPRRGAGLRS